MENPEELEGLLRPLLPPGAVACAAAASAPPADWAERYPGEAARVEAAAAPRRAEFFGGRVCARRCLAALGRDPVAIPSDEAGLPVWPPGVAGSITHSRGLCLAVAAQLDMVCALGIDLERSGRMRAAAAERVLHPDEQDFAGDDSDRATMIFSLKEAFFKCQFPVFGAQPGFRDVAFAVDEGASRARIASLKPGLSGELRAAAGRMEFRFARDGDWVVSLASLP